jgi:elongator complex protein 2
LQDTLWPEKDKLYGHGYELISVATSSDGQYIASACKVILNEYIVMEVDA